MSGRKNINLSLDVVKELDERKGDRSYSQFLADLLGGMKDAKTSKYGLESLSVGDETLVPFEYPDGYSAGSPTWNRLRSSINHFNRRLGWEFESRVDGMKISVRRTK